VLPKVSQELLAEMIGTTRPRDSFCLNKFRKLGPIECNGEIHNQQFSPERCPARVTNRLRAAQYGSG